MSQIVICLDLERIPWPFSLSQYDQKYDDNILNNSSPATYIAQYERDDTNICMICTYVRTLIVCLYLHLVVLVTSL